MDLLDKYMISLFHLTHSFPSYFLFNDNFYEQTGKTMSSLLLHVTENHYTEDSEAKLLDTVTLKPNCEKMCTATGHRSRNLMSVQFIMTKPDQLMWQF
jgi:hypothetical protein